MNIGLICYQYPLYQGGSHLQDFITALSKNPKVTQINLISTHHPKVPIKHIEKVKIIFIPSLFLFPIFAMFFSPDFRKSDLINVISTRGIIPAKIFTKILKKPLIATIEILNNPSNNSPLVDKISYLFQKFCYSKIKFDKIICWSKFYYHQYLKPWGISKKNVSYITNGINTDQYNPNISGKFIKNKYSPKTPLVVFAKPLYQYNFVSARLLIQTTKKLVDQNFPIHLLLGKGQYLPQAKKIIKKLKLKKYVSFMPFVPMTQIPRYIAASDIIVLPFLYEATVSRSLLEAMSIGKAIITSNSGEIPFILDHQKDAILVKPTINNLIKNIKYLLENKDVAKKIGKSAREKCIRYYSFNEISDQTVNLYQKIIDK